MYLLASILTIFPLLYFLTNLVDGFEEMNAHEREPKHLVFNKHCLMKMPIKIIKMLVFNIFQ